mmetsp:Transcript_24907/g.53055  ORF Transcript_24907/g.53055 Transcript_24907/m.53055 type:complete len:744 (-) Transcript_24907:714-2945(-)
MIEDDEINGMYGILRCLNLEECNPDIREQALCKLLAILRSTSQSCYADDRKRQVGEFLLENDVIEVVTKAMWADMEIIEVQDAVMNVLLFIAASIGIRNTGLGGDGEHKHGNSSGNAHMLSSNEVCDSILFTMQNHISAQGIQLKGILIFASLAASSSDNTKGTSNSDGSLSGALTMVLNAMSYHADSRSIRKAGLQALHHQCTLSAYAEANKRNLVESKLGNGMPAIELVIYAIEELQQDLVAMEWACQLCWCLTASDELLKRLQDTSLHEATTSVCRHFMTNPNGIVLVESSIGTIANLAYLERKRKEMRSIGTIELILDGLRCHRDHFGISFEATLALENLALPPNFQDSPLTLLKSDAVPMLVQRLKTFIDYPEYAIQGLRTLACIAAQSEEAKERINSREIISIVHELSRKHREIDMLEMCCIFIATLAMSKSAATSDFLMEQGVVDLLINAMETSNEEKVQDAACLALRNISCRIEKLDLLLRGCKTSMSVVGAMEVHRNNLSIQTSGCCIIWNLLSKTKETEFALNAKIVNCVTKAMQSHIESGELLELACGALWVVADNFVDEKVYIGNEAIDVVTCAMVMHPNTTSTLEKACGLLSNLSSDELLAKAIAKAQGVNIISEAMCNNRNSICLLESGCLTLKNITLVCPSFAQDGSVALSTLIHAMNENVESTSFIKEACDMLWVVASKDENIRSKVVALEGISVLMKCLEQNDPEVQTSALGAFNQLAKANSQKIS